MLDAELLKGLTPVFFATKTDMDEYHAALILLNYFRSFESNDTVVEVLERILVRDEAGMAMAYPRQILIRLAQSISLIQRSSIEQN